jgi:hypothetical protein
VSFRAIGLRMLSVCGGLVSFGLVLTLGFYAYSEFDFRSAKTQRAQLAEYVPEAKCQKADFHLMERAETLRDYRYVFLISGSAECARSLRSALVARGATRGGVLAADSDGTLSLPGHDEPGKNVVVSFDFDSEPGKVIWTRDKT